MTGKGSRTATWVVDDERAAAGYRVLLAARPRAWGWFLRWAAASLDWLHGASVLLALFGLSPVLAVALQYDPTGYLSEDHDNAVALAPYWKEGALTAAVGAVLAAASALLLVAVCRGARSRLPELATQAPPPQAGGPDVPLVTVRELRSRRRWQGGLVLVAGLVGGAVLDDVFDRPLWAAGLTVPARLGRLAEVVLLGFALLLGLVCALLLMLVGQSLVRICGSVAREQAFAALGVRLEAPAAPSRATGPGTSAVAEAPRKRVTGPDPALLAFLAVPPAVLASGGRRRVQVPCSADRVPEKALVTWMVAASVWWLQEIGLIRFRVVRSRLLRSRRVLLERVAPGSAPGVVASWLSGAPTQDPDALLGEVTLDRPGVLGELRRLVGQNSAWVGKDPYAALAKEVFRDAVAAGHLSRPEPEALHYVCSALDPLREAAIALAERFDAFGRTRPDTAALLLRESRRALRGASRITDLDEPMTNAKDVLVLVNDLWETWRGRRRRVWPTPDPGGAP